MKSSRPSKSARPNDRLPGQIPASIWACALFVIIATIITYIPAMHGGFIWDDDSYITRNPLLLDWQGLRWIWFPGDTPMTRTPQYYPVIFSMFWVEHKMWGLDPMGYHIVNVLLHATNALLVWRLCLRIGIPLGWLVALVFAVHPVHVESVAWITERKNVLSALFYLLAALSYLRFDQSREEAGGRTPWLWYGCAFGCFVLALLSKSVTCSLPAALILMMLYQRKRMSLARLLPLAPLFLIGLLLALNTAAVEKAHVGAEGSEFAFSFAQRLIIASRSLLFYPWKLVWPWPVMFIYPRWEIDAGAAAAFWPVAVVGVALVIGILAYGRGWRGPVLAAAFYAGTIFPALGFINIYPMRFSFVADHFQYLASLGIIVLIIGAFTWLVRDTKKLILPGVGFVFALGIISFQQAQTYASAETVYRDTLSKNNEAWMPHNNLANLLIDRDPVEAEQHYREALRIKADHYTAQSNLAEALRRQHRLEEAIVEIKKAIDLVHESMAAVGTNRPPRYLASDYTQLGRLQLQMGQRDAARAALLQAIAIDPADAEAKRMLGAIERSPSR